MKTHAMLRGRFGTSFAIIVGSLISRLTALDFIRGVHPENVGKYATLLNCTNGEIRNDCFNQGPAWHDFCGVPKSQGQLPQELDLAARQAEVQIYGRTICSQVGQDYILASIYDKIGTTNKYFVEFGARAPQVLNSAHFRLNCGWRGLLMDGAPGATPHAPCPNCADLKSLLSAPDDAPVRLRQAFLTKENVNDLFTKMNVPESFDLLTVDIDGMDYWVLTGLDMTKFLPRVVAVEFSSYFSKDEVLVPKYNPKFVWRPPDVVGSSLAALDALMTSRGYSYVTQVAGEHAIWVLNSSLHEKDRGKVQIPEHVFEGWQSAGGAIFIPENFEAPPKISARAYSQTSDSGPESAR